MFCRLYFVAFFLIPAYSLEEYNNLGSCKENTVPYRIVVDAYGRPELSCTVPFCFDLVPFNNKELQNKTCGGFTDDSCSRPNEMVGGLMEVKSGNDLRLKTRCCAYSRVEQARKVKTMALVAGDQFTGGVYVGDDGDWQGFDLVKDIRRVVEPASVIYEVDVVRMPCQVKNLGGLSSPMDLKWPPADNRRSSHPSAENVFMQPPVQSRRAPTMGFRRNFVNDDYYDYYEEQYGGQQVAGYGLSQGQQLSAPLVVVAPPTPVVVTDMPTMPTSTPYVPQAKETSSPNTLPPLPLLLSSSLPPSSSSSSTEETVTIQPVTSLSTLLKNEKKNPKRIKFNPRWNKKKEMEMPVETSSGTTQMSEQPTTTEEVKTEPPVIVEHTLSQKEEESLKSSFVQQE